MTIKFFVAASWEDKKIAEGFANEITKKYNWENVSIWWTHADRNKKLQYAMEDLENLKKADVLFVYNGELKTAGKLIEIGIALGLGKPIFLYGNELTTVYNEIIIYKGEKF